MTYEQCWERLDETGLGTWDWSGMKLEEVCETDRESFERFCDIVRGGHYQ
jgi:hypothetical protein